VAVFEFRGVEVASGKSVKGFRDAENPKALRMVLRRDGILLTQATIESARVARDQKAVDPLAFMRRPSARDVSIMTRQLATLVRAGVPLVESVAALTEQVENQQLVRILTTVRESLNAGTSFAKSLEAHPKTFVNLYTNMIAAGEASGTLEAVLERLADFMEGQAKLRGKVAGALAYPALMSVFGIGLVAFLMVAVVPKVTTVFDSLGQALPWYTRLLIAVSDIVAGYWWALLGGAGAAWYSFRRFKSTPAGKLRWETFRLRAPLFGRLELLACVARFCRTLATLLASGVQLLPALEIGRNVLENAKLEGVVDEAIVAIRGGDNIAEPLKRSRAFPPMVTHMIAVGERTGQLEAMLENVSRSYEADVEVRVTALTSILEPLIIMILGVMVGFVAFAILMPLIQMNQLVE
jgi:general secretion pathway protein F